MQTPSRASLAHTEVSAIHKYCAHHQYPVGEAVRRFYLHRESGRRLNNDIWIYRGIYPNCQRRGILSDSTPITPASSPLTNSALSPR